MDGSVVTVSVKAGNHSMEKKYTVGENVEEGYSSKSDKEYSGKYDKGELPVPSWSTQAVNKETEKVDKTTKALTNLLDSLTKAKEEMNTFITDVIEKEKNGEKNK
eukprot:g2357.t1